jgi:glycosyltransferase involved in cell wall biosynthesis
MTEPEIPPIVSIGMPVYNGEKTIREALDSLLAQDFKDFELIISDNSSTDSTPQICKKYMKMDPRIRYYRNKKNIGAAANFDRLVYLAQGKYFMWASHDDYWNPRYLQSCREAFNLSEDIVLAGAVCESIDPETEEVIFTDQGFSTIGLKPRERFMLYKSTIHGGRHIGGIFSGIYKLSALREVMPIRKVIAGDHLILAELCFLGEFVTVQERLMFKRWGGASTSHKNNARALCLTNPLYIMFPYFVREILLQKMIFHTDKLTMPEKIRLSCWSLVNYIQDCLIKETIYSTYNYLKTLKVKVLFGNR